ncbi:TPA: MerR family transcriptional regulator [Streptococcus agalactiae]|nr:MerR family transcriptional regulator [Streptococcus agalactiae]
MHIKEVSKKTGITSDTIRYYERINLIPPIHRSESGIREFTQNDIDILEFVRYFRGAGVSVESLIDYIHLVEKGDSTIPARLEILKDKRNNLEDRLQGLQEALNRLNHKIDNYQKVLVPR